MVPPQPPVEDPEDPDALRRSAEIPPMYEKPDIPEREWGSWIQGKHGAIVHRMALNAGLDGKKIITRGGQVAVNPVPIPKTKMVWFPDGNKESGKRWQAVMGGGVEVPAVRGPLAKYKKPSKVVRNAKRELERICFGGLLESKWLAGKQLVNQFAAVGRGDTGTDKRVIQVNNLFVRQKPFLDGLKLNLGPQTVQPFVRRRRQWSSWVPCVAGWKKVVIGDSQVARLPLDMGYKCLAFPGADIRTSSKSNKYMI